MIIGLLRSRIAAWTKADIHAMEPSMVLQYREGQHFQVHRDALNPNLPAMAQQIRLQAPRTLHAGLPPRGGETWGFGQWIRTQA